jgi:hypothetical protein
MGLGRLLERTRYRRLLQQRWWPLSDLPVAPPRGHANDVFFNNGSGRCWTYRQHPRGPAINVLLQVFAIASIFWQHFPGGHYDKHYYEQYKTSQKSFLGPCDAKDLGKISVWKIKCEEVPFNKIKAQLFIHKKTQWQLDRKTYTSSG